MKHKKTTVVIGVSSGIAAYKILDLIGSLRKKGMQVRVIMTQSATAMMGVGDFEKASGQKVYTSLFEKNFNYKKILASKTVDHIKIADEADIFVIAPATANICGKIANGFADDFLTTSVMATQAPVLVCPSMNVHMWNNPLVQKNIRTLQENGYFILHPDSGALACGYTGVGRLPKIETIGDEILSIVETRRRLTGQKIIVTAGGTSEKIDAVRMITNKSSGKMGVALAESCFQQGADVLLLRSTTSVNTNYPMKVETFETGKELESLIRKNITSYDSIIHNAAVSDFIPREVFEKKLDSKKSLTIHLETTVKILSQIKKWNPKIKLIGFKAVCNESKEEMLEMGRRKLDESSADYIVVNDIGVDGIGFGSDDNEVYVVSKNGDSIHVGRMSKKNIAREVLHICFK